MRVRPGSVAHEQNLKDIDIRYVDVEPFDFVLERVRGANHEG